MQLNDTEIKYAKVFAMVEKEIDEKTYNTLIELATLDSIAYRVNPVISQSSRETLFNIFEYDKSLCNKFHELVDPIRQYGYLIEKRKNNLLSSEDYNFFNVNGFHETIDTYNKNITSDGDNLDFLYDLGTKYYNGFGDGDGFIIFGNMDESIKWLRKADDAGHNEARYLLGDLYFGELIYPSNKSYRNIDRAIYFYNQAAEDNHRKSQYTLARIYQFGLNGIDQDVDKARKWYKKASILSPDSSYRLSNCDNRATDLKSLISLVTRAVVDAGDIDAKSHLDDLNTIHNSRKN